MLEQLSGRRSFLWIHGEHELTNVDDVFLHRNRVGRLVNHLNILLLSLGFLIWTDFALRRLLLP